MSEIKRLNFQPEACHLQALVQAGCFYNTWTKQK